MELEPDDDDLLPETTWKDVYYGIFNRWAEQCAAWARALGFLP